MKNLTEDAKHCYLISYRHPEGYGSVEMQFPEPLTPYSTNSVIKKLQSFTGYDSIVIINVFFQGAFSTEALANFKKESEVEQHNTDGFIVMAGKYEESAFNCKYSSELHLTLDDAIEDYDGKVGYPVTYFEYKDRYLLAMPKGFNPYE